MKSLRDQKTRYSMQNSSLKQLIKSMQFLGNIDKHRQGNKVNQKIFQAKKRQFHIPKKRHFMNAQTNFIEYNKKSSGIEYLVNRSWQIEKRTPSKQKQHYENKKNTLSNKYLTIDDELGPNPQKIKLRQYKQNNSNSVKILNYTRFQKIAKDLCGTPQKDLNITKLSSRRVNYGRNVQSVKLSQSYSISIMPTIQNSYHNSYLMKIPRKRQPSNIKFG